MMSVELKSVRCTDAESHSCRLPGCQNTLSGKQKGFCSSKCKNDFFSLARKVGVDRLRNKSIRVARQEYVDLDAMTQAERRIELCQVAGKMGLLS